MAKRSRAGLNALKARVQVRGLQAIDRRIAAAKVLLGWQDELLGALGGDDRVSPQQRALVDLAVRTRLYVESIDAWIMRQPSLVLARKRSVLPVVRERQALADSLARLLGQLGLERRVKEVPTLMAYLAAKVPETTNSAKEPRKG